MTLDHSPENEFSQWQGRALIVISAVCWSTSGFFVKSPWFDGWVSEDRGCLIAFFRSLFAVPLLIPLVKRFEFHPRLIVMTVCFAVMVWTFMSAMVHGTAANAIWLQYLCPAWVLVWERVRGRTGIRQGDSRMLGFCMSGVALILLMEMRLGVNLYATSLGLISGMAYAGVLTSMKALRQIDPAWLITLNHIATVFILAPAAWTTHSPINVTGYAALAFFGLFQMSLPYLMFARGLNGVGSLEASILTLIEPLLVPVWVFVAWHHHPSYQPAAWWTWIGGTLIFTGLLVRYVPEIGRQGWQRSRRG